MRSDREARTHGFVVGYRSEADGGTKKIAEMSEGGRKRLRQLCWPRVGALPGPVVTERKLRPAPSTARPMAQGSRARGQALCGRGVEGCRESLVVCFTRYDLKPRLTWQLSRINEPHGLSTDKHFGRCWASSGSAWAEFEIAQGRSSVLRLGRQLVQEAPGASRPRVAVFGRCLSRKARSPTACAQSAPGVTATAPRWSWASQKRFGYA